MIDAGGRAVRRRPALEMSTLRRRIDDPAELQNPERHEGRRRSRRVRAVFLARADSVHARRAARRPPAWRHIGLYVYRRDVPAAPGRAAADRAGARRGARAAARARARHPDQGDRNDVHDSIGVDTPEDLERVRRTARAPACRRTRRSRDERPNADAHSPRQRPVKYILVTGGVVSSLGKGLAAASIGALLEGHGYKVALQKFDPYINVDPGTMSPYQHGEVYVTDDGAETDLDLGHYERFTNQIDDAQQQLDDRQDLPVGDPEGAARRLPRAHRAGHPAHHQRDQGQHPGASPRTSTSSSSRSAARSATSRACRSSRRSASCARTSAARTRSTST